MNINLGVLGHVDSGKTSLCKVLSTTASTAAFDSNPQSVEKKITLDLGFSSFKLKNYNFTLVDCPGHSSLIRTVIGGSQIMDIMLLVIDAVKGMQAQTAECLILATITSKHLIVVLNKTDLVPEKDRDKHVAKMRKLMSGVLSKTQFKSAPIVTVSATDEKIGTKELTDSVLDIVENVQFDRNISAPFLMAIDHCFIKKGQGAILTGTILQGVLKINDIVELPSLQESKKVKSIQCFHENVSIASAGDRIGINLPGLNTSVLERTVLTAPKLISSSVYLILGILSPIKYFKKPISSKKKYHISIGYDTLTAKLTLFTPTSPSSTNSPPKDFSLSRSYDYLDFLTLPSQNGGKEGEKSDSKENEDRREIFGILEFDSPAMLLPNLAPLIGSDLQSESGSSSRLAFSATSLQSSSDKNYAESYLPTLPIYKRKVKRGSVERVVSDSVVIVRGFCKKESNVEHLVGLSVKFMSSSSSSGGDGTYLGRGRVEGRFGQTNKMRVGICEISNGVELGKAEVLLEYKTKIFRGSGRKRDMIQEE